MKIKLSVMIAVLAMLPSGVALATETGTTRVDVELMAAPYRDATVAGKLAVNTQVELRERRGAWVRVTAADKNGWVRLHNVRLGEGNAQKGSSGFAALWNIGATGRSGTQGIVATTGIRGMSADQLKNAKPDPDEFDKLDRYRANEDQARDLAKAGGLNEKDVAVLPKPN